MPAPRRWAAPFDAYLELHIEQAPVLGREGCDIGIVVGGYKTQALRLTINGDTGHAGGTPMAMRRTPWSGAGYVIAAVNDIGLAYAADEGRTTTTRHRKLPQPAGTYAEQVKLTIDFRHIDGDRFLAMRKDVDAAIAAAAKKATSRSTSRKAGAGAASCSRPECIELLKSTARELGLPYREMRSQAGHDAYAVATMAPTAMIFTPCFEGISHNVNEAIELAARCPAPTCC
jgi:N-carbamoyl-L-amino-acid hydrolase